MCFKTWSKNVKNLDIWDMGLTKLSVAAFVLLILSIWPAAIGWVGSVSPWYFLIFFIIFAIRPLTKFFKK